MFYFVYCTHIGEFIPFLTQDAPYDANNPKHIHISKFIVAGFIQECQLKSFSTMKTEYDPAVLMESQIEILVKQLIYRELLPIKYVYT